MQSKKPIFCVAGVSEDPIRHRVWGYFHSKYRALEAALGNESDIFEAGHYPFALVTEVRPGLGELPKNRWWFLYINKRYVEIPEPKWAERYGWMGVPEIAIDPRDARIKDLEDALRLAQNHVTELAEAWRRGVIRENDTLGGTRSNRNMDVLTALRDVLVGKAGE